MCQDLLIVNTDTYGNSINSINSIDSINSTNSIDTIDSMSTIVLLPQNQDMFQPLRIKQR